MEIEVEAKQGPRRTTILGLAHLFAHQLNLEFSKKTLIIAPKRNLLKEYGAYGVSGAIGEEIRVAVDCALPKNKLLYTIAHEMVHVKQLARGALRQDEDGQFYWRGKLFSINNIPYVDRPWEREAYSMQELMVRRLCA